MSATSWFWIEDRNRKHYEFFHEYQNFANTESISVTSKMASLASAGQVLIKERYYIVDKPERRLPEMLGHCQKSRQIF